MPSTLTSTPLGPLLLEHEDGGPVHVRAVRYATASRWGFPQVLRGTQTVQAAHRDPVAAGTVCPQERQRTNKSAFAQLPEESFSEHCQYLSIITPDMPIARVPKLPVMVWVHGGGYVAGSGDWPGLDPSALVRAGSVVVVTVNYRLGIFGFLGDGVTYPRNLGMYDVAAALRWVRENIATFGGDAECVTVFGQSSGADLITGLLELSQAKAPFHRAILQSPPLGLIGPRSDRVRRSAMSYARSWMDPLTPVQTLLTVQNRIERRSLRYGTVGLMPFGRQPEPNTSGDAAPCRDVLIGTVAHETGMYVRHLASLRTLTRSKTVGAAVGRLFVQPTSDRVFTQPVAVFAQDHARRTGNPVYVYNFRQARGETPLVHGDDVTLLFGPGQKSQHATALHAVWPRFASTGTAESTGALRVQKVSTTSAPGFAASGMAFKDVECSQ